MTDACPLCDANLQGAPIPQEYIDKGHYRPGATHYSRMVGHEIRGVYDGVLYWSCPECLLAWPRWTDGGRRSLASAEHVARFNAERIAS